MIGRTIGHYRIEARLGAGGMGVVYRAADSRLGREVALKVLPDLFARDPERLARFQQEARLVWRRIPGGVCGTWATRGWTIRTVPSGCAMAESCCVNSSDSA